MRGALSTWNKGLDFKKTKQLDYTYILFARFKAFWMEVVIKEFSVHMPNSDRFITIYQAFDMYYYITHRKLDV